MVEIEEVEPAAPPTEQAAERRSDKNWLAQMAKQAEKIKQPDACLPVADGMALDQLLTKMRVAAEMAHSRSALDQWSVQSTLLATLVLYWTWPSPKMVDL